MEQIYGTLLSQNVCMRMTHLTPKQLSSVPCPSCGAASGHLCELHSGGLRVEPHLDRKLAAVEAVETKRMHVASESRLGPLSVNKGNHRPHLDTARQKCFRSALAFSPISMPLTETRFAPLIHRLP